MMTAKDKKYAERTEIDSKAKKQKRKAATLRKLEGFRSSVDDELVNRLIEAVESPGGLAPGHPDWKDYMAICRTSSTGARQNKALPSLSDEERAECKRRQPGPEWRPKGVPVAGRLKAPESTWVAPEWLSNPTLLPKEPPGGIRHGVGCRRHKVTRDDSPMSLEGWGAALGLINGWPGLAWKDS